MSDLILIIDDDPDVRSVVDITLRLAGFDVATAPDGETGLEEALKQRPDLILLDLMMPRMDGYEVCRRLRSDGRLSHIPVIMLTAKAQLTDKIAGLEYGADDYVTKPFDTEELAARVQATLRRALDSRSVSPLTGLPGNVRIEQELSRRVDADEPLAVLYADLNRFKAYNDHYGFLRGDEAIRSIAEALRTAASRVGDEETFVGHIGGDDFVILTDPEIAEPMAEAVIEEFEAAVPALYDAEDREAGYIEVEDRKGQMHRFPLISVSIGIVTNEKRSFEDHRQVVEVATEMKSFAKRSGDNRSNYASDRRTGE